MNELFFLRQTWFNKPVREKEETIANLQAPTSKTTVAIKIISTKQPKLSQPIIQYCWSSHDSDFQFETYSHKYNLKKKEKYLIKLQWLSEVHLLQKSFKSFNNNALYDSLIA